MIFAFGNQTRQRLRGRAEFKIYLQGSEARLKGYARALWQLFNSLFDDIICQGCRNNVLVNTRKSALVGHGFFCLFLCVSASPLEHGRHRRQRSNRRRHRPVDESGGEYQSRLISDDPQHNLVGRSLSSLYLALLAFPRVVFCLLHETLEDDVQVECGRPSQNIHPILRRISQISKI